MDTYDYTHGYCHVFALALHEIFDYDIVAIQDVDLYVEDKNGKHYPYMTHVFCIKNNNAIDAVGVRTVKDIRKDILGETLRLCHVSEKAISRWTKVSYEPYNNAMVDEAIKFILRNRKKYLT